MTTATRSTATSGESVDPSLQFPESAALILREWAAKAGDDWAAAVNAALDKIKDALGHPELLYDRAADWAPGASGLLNDAAHGLGSARDNVKMYWEGQAFDAFDTYTTQVVGTSRDAAKVLGDLSTKVNDIGNFIVDTYREMIKNLGDTATSILDAVSGVGGMLADAITPLAAIGMAITGACDLLKTFVDFVNKTADAALLRMEDFRKAVHSIASDVSLLVLPDPIPAGVAISDNWDVHGAK